jgi:selenium-binding protein 1
MQRREFLKGMASASLVAATPLSRLFPQEDHDHAKGDMGHCHPTYATVKDAIASPPEQFAFVPAILAGTTSDQPDYMATVDVDPASPTYSQIVGRLPMPFAGDELHHYGWNACSSCHGTGHRRYLVVPGLTSGNIHVIDAANPAKLKHHTMISGEEIAKKHDLSTPHTVHCLADGTVVISMLGNGAREAPGGFLAIDSNFNVVGPWQKSLDGMHFNYDYWYQPRHNVMVSSEWAAPNTVSQGFSLDDVKAGKYGHRLQFWNWEGRRIEQTIDLGPDGLIPLEVRFHHDPDSTHGFVGAALSSAIFHWHKNGDRWVAKKVVQVDPVETEGWPFPVPGLITDVVLSMDDRFLYFSNWLHGDIRQYDVSDPAHPKLTGQIWLGGLIGHPSDVRDRQVTGGPQMLQLSLDGRRLYVTSSLYSVWDNQFYPKMAERGSWMMQVDCDTKTGGLELNREFFVDFGREPWGPARAHEIRFPGGDSTSDIWV